MLQMLLPLPVAEPCSPDASGSRLLPGQSPPEQPATNVSLNLYSTSLATQLSSCHTASPATLQYEGYLLHLLHMLPGSIASPRTLQHDCCRILQPHIALNATAPVHGLEENSCSPMLLQTAKHRLWLKRKWISGLVQQLRLPFNPSPFAHKALFRKR
jgi:hypothetical protein